MIDYKTSLFAYLSLLILITVITCIKSAYKLAVKHAQLKQYEKMLNDIELHLDKKAMELDRREERIQLLK